MGVDTINTITIMGTNYSYLKVKLKMKNHKVKEEYKFKNQNFSCPPSCI